MTRLALLSTVLALAACGGPAPLRIQSERPVHLSSAPPGLNVADAALAGGVPETALAITRSLIEAHPRNVGALVKQGDALAAMGRPDAAGECYRRALAVDSRAEGALLALGRMALANGRPADAEAMFRRMGVSNAQAQNNLGIALDMQDRHAEAQAAYSAALHAAPEMVAASVNLGHSYALAGDRVRALAILQPLAGEPMATEHVRGDLAAALSLAGDPASADAILRADATPLPGGYRAMQAAR